MTDATGRIVRHDLMCTDPAAAVTFYRTLFGWQVTELKVMGFTVRRLALGEQVLGAIMPFDPQLGFPSHWVPYMHVESVDETCRRVTELGGEVCMGAMDIPPGRFALTNDPTGGLFSPFTPRQAVPEIPVPALPGTFCWDELLTTGPAAAVSFYASLFGWEPVESAMPNGGTYTVMRRGGVQAAGVMARPSGVTFRSSWLPYVAAADVDATAAQARHLGATITTPPTDIPGIGRFAVLTDPTAARLAILSAAS